MSDKWVEDSDAWRDGHSDDDSFDDDSFDRDWDDDSTSEDNPNDVIECPMCGCDVYENAEQCPLCGEWITRNTSPWADKPMWWVWLGLAGIVAVIMTLTFMW